MSALRELFHRATDKNGILADTLLPKNRLRAHWSSDDPDDVQMAGDDKEHEHKDE